MKIAYTLALTAITSLSLPALAAPKQHHINLLTGSAGASSSKLETYDTHVKSESGDALMLIYNAFAGLKDNDVHLYYEVLAAKTDLTPVLSMNDSTREVTLDATHLHIGGTYEWQSAKYFHPYFGMTMGRSHIESITGRDDSFWGFSAATGFNIPVSEHFAIRADARVFLMRWDNDTALLCPVTEEPCEINLNDNSWLHHQLTIGAAFRF